MDDSEIHTQCITDDILYDYLNKIIKKKERRTVEAHVNSCDHCLHRLATLLRMAYAPITMDEKEELDRLRTMTPEEQVERIIRYNKQLNLQKKTSIIEKLEILLKGYRLKPVYAIVVLGLVIVLVNRGLNYYHTGFQVERAETMLIRDHGIFIKDARVSGGYGPSAISILLSPEKEKSPYLKQAEKRLKQATLHDANDPRATQLLAQVYIFQKDLPKADSLLMKLRDSTPPSAELMNDIGVVYFQKQDWQRAAANFRHAIEINGQFAEAYFNLALVLIKMQSPQEAAPVLRKYQQLETDENWKNAAQWLLDNTQKSEVE